MKSVVIEKVKMLDDSTLLEILKNQPIEDFKNWQSIIHITAYEEAQRRGIL